MDENTYNKHYIRIDGNGNIIRGFSDAFEQPQDGDILTRDDGGRHFELDGVVNLPLLGEYGNPLYRYDRATGEMIVNPPYEADTTAEELAEAENLYFEKYMKRDMIDAELGVSAKSAAVQTIAFGVGTAETDERALLKEKILNLRVKLNERNESK